jgi:hypothetical protein
MDAMAIFEWAGQVQATGRAICTDLRLQLASSFFNFASSYFFFWLEF